MSKEALSQVTRTLHETPRRLWRHPHFSKLLLAHWTSNVGDWLAFMALFGLAALELRADIAGIGALAVAYMLPLVVIAPLAGVLVDGWDLRPVLVTTDLCRAALLCWMAFASSLPTLCLLLFLHQAATSFFNPAQHAAIPRLVERPAILAANALAAQAAHATKVIGPAAGGALVALLGARGCFLLDAASFVLSALLLLRLPSLPGHPAQMVRRSLLGDLRSGAAFVRNAPRIGLAIAALSGCVAGFGAFLVTLPIFARDVLGYGSGRMGLLLSGLGAGAMAGAALVSRLGSGSDRLRLMSWAGVVAGVAMLGLPIVRAAALPASMIVGVGVAVLLVAAHTLVQEETPSPLRGRVIGLSLAVLGLAQVAGMAAAALLSRHGETSGIVQVAALLITIAGVGLSAVAWLRRLGAPPGAATKHVSDPR